MHKESQRFFIKKNSKKVRQKEKEKVIKIPIKALSDVELINYAKQLKIPFFRGVFSRDELPKKPWVNERGIVNYITSQDTKMGHWCCYRKVGKNVWYLDPIGNLPPCSELKNYLKGCKIFYNYNQKQKYGTVICGHIVLRWLSQKNV